jgi:hypothetical protein
MDEEIYNVEKLNKLTELLETETRPAVIEIIKENIAELDKVIKNKNIEDMKSERKIKQCILQSM